MEAVPHQGCRVPLPRAGSQRHALVICAIFSCCSFTMPGYAPAILKQELPLLLITPLLPRDFPPSSAMRRLFFAKGGRAECCAALAVAERDVCSPSEARK